MPADLHLHSTYSDGSCQPEELLKLTQSRKLDTIAITDHDTIKGSKEAVKVKENYDIEVIPAIEFSTKAEIHILGYYIDFENRQFNREVDNIFQGRIKRAEKMIKKLNKLGIEININKIKNKTIDEYIGRPHIAQEMVENGYISEIGDAFTERYIGNNGQAYVNRYKVTQEKAIKLIKEAAGIPIVAHPAGFSSNGFQLNQDDILKLKEKGLMGIEVFHSRHSTEEREYYRSVAEELDLVITGGSDFHGDKTPEIELGDIKLKSKYVERLKALK